jgi:glycosyltransferase involved in cell wall biosynthesis
MTCKIVALLGRKDEPTDAVEDYSRHLGEALRAHDFQLEIRRVPWNQCGWSASFEALRLQAESWRDTWVLVQYTALAWSSRGFPRRFLSMLRVLRRAGARIMVVYHDVDPFDGNRLIDRLRRSIQVKVMRDALLHADRAVFTVDLDRLQWLPRPSDNSTFIPVGANLPFPIAEQQHVELHSPPTIAVFSITGGTSGERETRNIIAAVRFASGKLGALRLNVFGRHAEERESALWEGLREVPVELQVQGVVDDANLIEQFAASDVLLFVRGPISSRRGSAIAGISCGLPVIALQGAGTAAPITETGVLLVAEQASETALQLKLGEALVRVLSEKDLRAELVQRNRTAQEQHFSWSAIAKRYVKLLQSSD